MPVDVIIEDSRWREADVERIVTRAFEATMTFLGFDANACEVAVLAADDARVMELNRHFRGKAQPTNVLSWPSEERGADVAGERPSLPAKEAFLGDIALAYETCSREAAAQGKPEEQHFVHLAVHGVLHLLGYDHERDEDGDLMESTEIAILRELGVPNPYV